MITPLVTAAIFFMPRRGPRMASRARPERRGARQRARGGAPADALIAAPTTPSHERLTAERAKVLVAWRWLWPWGLS
ncbi:MAG TPA: hypothetical protein VIF57_01790 [Polyangia bacterium]|jgi:hypothetical protein